MLNILNITQRIYFSKHRLSRAVDNYFTESVSLHFYEACRGGGGEGNKYPTSLEGNRQASLIKWQVSP